MSFSFFYKWRVWWEKHGWGIILFSSLLILFFLWFFYSRHRPNGTSSASWDEIFSRFTTPSPLPERRTYVPPPVSSFSPTSSSSIMMSKGERACKEFLEFALQKPFHKRRPSFLLNPVTGRPLELDLYNEDLRLAVEYNGSQHYEFNQKMHPSRDSFHNQKYRDLIKKQLCERHGIHLIIVPYTVPIEKIPEFLFQSLRTSGYLHK